MEKAGSDVTAAMFETQFITFFFEICIAQVVYGSVTSYTRGRGFARHLVAFHQCHSRKAHILKSVNRRAIRSACVSVRWLALSAARAIINILINI